MAINWPPIPNPWPPPEIGMCVFADLMTFITEMTHAGFTWRNPTQSENNTWFRDARCDENHPVAGIMIVSPGGELYPFAFCNSASHRTVLVLWEPYDLGSLSKNAL